MGPVGKVGFSMATASLIQKRYTKPCTGCSMEAWYSGLSITLKARPCSGIPSCCNPIGGSALVEEIRQLQPEGLDDQ